MNLAFYVDSIFGDENTLNLFGQLNRLVEEKLVDDACVFYNKVNQNPIIPKFGLFNATDIWNYTGVLVATTPNNVLYAHSIINKFKLYYLLQERDFVGLIKLPNVPILVKNKQDEEYIYRVTGKHPTLINSVEDILTLEGAKNGDV